MSTIQERLREPLFLLDSDQGCIADSQRQKAANVIDGLVEALRSAKPFLQTDNPAFSAFEERDALEKLDAAFASIKCEDKS